MSDEGPVAEPILIGVSGCIDGPRQDDPVDPLELEVSGWAYAADDVVSRIDIHLNGQLLGQAGLGRPRPDVAASLSDPRAVLSGFEFYGSAKDTEGVVEADLVVTVHLLDGRPVDWGPVRVVLTPPRAPEPARRPDASGPPARRRRRRRGPLRVLWSARSLDRGGSQLRMAEVIGHLGRTGGFASTVLCHEEGPLRDVIEGAGATVRIEPPPPLDDLAGYERTLEAWSSWADGQFDVVVGATVTSFPAADLAGRLGLPYVLRLGESEPLRTVVRWLYGDLDEEIERRARTTFRGAFAFVSVSHEAARRYRADGIEARYVVLNTGVDIEQARAYAAATGREETRRQLGIEPDRRVLVCAATIWKVKGQADLVSALARLHQSHPELMCVLVGTAAPPYLTALTVFSGAQGMSDAVRVLPHTDDLRPLWRAADIAVCSSESEAFPAAVLEAMSYGLPVLGAAVGDVPLMVEPGVSGWLFQPSDLASLVTQLGVAATASDPRLQEMGQAGQEIAARYDHRTNLDRWSELITCAADGTPPPWSSEFEDLPRRRWRVRPRSR